MGDDNDKNILYGGPEPPLIDDDSKSLGEVILKKLNSNGDSVMFVSMDGVGGSTVKANKPTNQQPNCELLLARVTQQKLLH